MVTGTCLRTTCDSYTVSQTVSTTVRGHQTWQTVTVGGAWTQQPSTQTILPGVQVRRVTHSPHSRSTWRLTCFGTQIGLADFLARGLRDVAVAGLRLGAERSLLHGAAGRIPDLLQVRLADRTADRVRDVLDDCAAHRRVDGVAARLVGGLAHGAADGVRDALGRALLHGLHHRVALRLEDRLLTRDADRLGDGLIAGLRDGPAHASDDRLVRRLLDRAADRVRDALEDRLLHGPADGVGAGLVARLSDGRADVVDARLEGGLAHRAADGVRARLHVRLAHGALDRIRAGLPDRPRDRLLHGVSAFPHHRPIDRLLDGEGDLLRALFDDIPDRRDGARLHHRLADVALAGDLLRLVDRLLDGTHADLPLELILHVPTALLGHRATTGRGPASIAGRLRRAIGRPPGPHPQGHKGHRQKFTHGSRTPRRLPTSCTAAPTPAPPARRSHLFGEPSSVPPRPLQDVYPNLPKA